MKLLLTLFILIILIFYSINYFEKFNAQEVPNLADWTDILKSNKQMPDIFSLKRQIVKGVKNSRSNEDLKKSWMYDISSELIKDNNKYLIKNIKDNTDNLDTALNIGYCLSNLFGIPHTNADGTGTYPFPKPRDLNLNLDNDKQTELTDYIVTYDHGKEPNPLKSIFDSADMNKIKLCNSFNTYDENYKFSLDDPNSECTQQNMCKKKQDIYSNNKDYCVQLDNSFNIFNSKSSAVVSKCNELIRSNWEAIEKLKNLSPLGYQEVSDTQEEHQCQ